jgi:hypothetical protein
MLSIAAGRKSRRQKDAYPRLNTAIRLIYLGFLGLTALGLPKPAYGGKGIL